MNQNWAIKLLDTTALNLNLRLRKLSLDNAAVILVLPTDSLFTLPSAEHALILYQESEPLEDDEYPPCEPVIENINKFLDFLGELKDYELVKEVILVGDNDSKPIAAAYALGLCLLQEQKENDGISYLMSLDRDLIFDYWSVCAIDLVLNRNGKLIQAVEEYEATGLVVSSTGVVYTAED